MQYRLNVYHMSHTTTIPRLICLTKDEPLNADECLLYTVIHVMTVSLVCPTDS